jgi:hypothetical protein
MPKYFTSNIPDPVWNAYVMSRSDSDEEPEDRSECIGIPLDVIYSGLVPNAKLGLSYRHDGKSLLVVNKRFFPNSKPTDKLVLDHIIAPLGENLREIEYHKYGFDVTRIFLVSRGLTDESNSEIGIDVYTYLSTPDLPISVHICDYNYVTLSGFNSFDGYFTETLGYTFIDYVKKTRSLTNITDAKAIKLAAGISDGLRKLGRFNTHLTNIGLYLSE